MVGCEDRGNPIRHYLNELLEFRRTCDAAGLDIPFLFHAGETLRHGESTDENLFDAILLGSKRIGHGYGLARHPTLMNICRERGIALEICPISNEILHLCPSIQGHSLPILLTNGVPCTLSSDNPAYFRYYPPHNARNNRCINTGQLNALTRFLPSNVRLRFHVPSRLACVG